MVALTLSTGVVAETGFSVPDAGLLQTLGLILTLVRFDEETQPRQVGWRQTTEYPGLTDPGRLQIYSGPYLQIEVGAHRG